jgi:hypothetical protein
MNKTEKQMLGILKKLREGSGAVAVKAEFEAEGTRTEELLRLLEIARKADMGIGLKIGGCEAVRDLIEAKQFGVDYVIAPMVETAYALEKFVDAKNKTFSEEERQDTEFLVNIETITGLNNLDDMARVASTKQGINGLVFGRVDFVGSKGLSRDKVDDDIVMHDVTSVAKVCKRRKLDLVVGGGISVNSINALKSLGKVHLTRFETRKIIFSSNALTSKGLRSGLLNAVHFELLWLLNKREYYAVITKEDDKRIKMLNDRWKLLSNE